MSEAVLGLMLDKKETLKAAEKQSRVCFLKRPNNTSRAKNLSHFPSIIFVCFEASEYLSFA